MEEILRSKEIFKIIPFDYNLPVLFFPVRHHSPACSYHLQKVMEEYKPDCILVEGPQNANKLISVLTDEGTVPPVAFYYYYKDSEKHISEDADDYKCYYPFLSTSPEYNALVYARKNNTDCAFIDLPYGEILINTAEGKGLRRKSEVPGYSDDYYLSEGKYFAALCEKTGMRSFEEFWESFFETDALYISTEEFIARMYTYCYLLRENTPKEDMLSDGCIVRESHMSECIKSAMETHSRVLVVTGGFHSYGLYKLVSGREKPIKVKLHNFSDKVQDVYTMCYSYEAADALNGYASGMQNPGFYNAVWTELKNKTEAGEGIENTYDNVIMDTLLKCGRECSKSKLLITMSDISSAVTMYRGLAAVRDKKSAGLFELYDAVQSCFVKGELNASSRLPLEILNKIATGSGIGKLSDRAEKVPIIKDFEELSQKYRLKVNTVIEQKMELDIFSKPSHMEISRLFYRLSFLETGFAKRIKGADIINNTDRSRIREIWSYKRNTESDAVLIDSSVYGATIEEACTVCAARKLLNKQKASDAAKLYVESFLMGIDITESFAGKMQDIIIDDGDFFSIGKATYYFNMLRSLKRLYGVKNNNEEFFLIKCFDKAVTMLTSMINVSDDYADECIKICRLLYSLVTSTFLSDRYTILMDSFKRMTKRNDPQPAVYGAVLGLLYGSDGKYKDDISSALNGYLMGTKEMQKQGAVFLRGLFSTARDIVLVGNEFINITDKLIRKLSMEDFMEVLPELRLAFGYFTPYETDSIAKKASEIYGTDHAGILQGLSIYSRFYSMGVELEKEICNETGVSL